MAAVFSDMCPVKHLLITAHIKQIAADQVSTELAVAYNIGDRLPRVPQLPAPETTLHESH